MKCNIDKDGYLTSCSGAPQKLRLPPEVHEISGIFASAFEWCDELEKLILPSTVEWVETGGLSGAVNLRELIIEGSETGLDQFACAGCTKLERITFPSDNHSINGSAFCGTPWLKAQPYSAWIRDGELLCYGGDATEYSTPSHVDKVGENAFFGNRTLERVVIGSHVQTIDNAAFSMCEKLKEVCIEGQPSIAPDAFDGTLWLANQIGFLIDNDRLLRYIGSDSVLHIPDGIAEICAHAFKGNPRITSVTMPDTVKAIGINAFAHCSSLHEIHFSDSLTQIAGGAFTGCIALTSISLPQSLRCVGPFAFSNCENLSRVELPSRTISFGKGAFFRCDKLQHSMSASGLIEQEAFLFAPGHNS